jgi:hypothetical protein
MGSKSFERIVALSDTCSWFSIDRLAGYLVLIETWVMRARDEPEMSPRRRLYPTLGASRYRLHARVGEGEDTACSSRFSKFAVHDDANLRIGLESFEATRK